MIPSLILSALIGSLLWLDRVYVFQMMVSRPVFLSLLLGLAMGNVTVAVLVGASLELLWLNSPPVGSYLPPDESFAAAAAVPVAFFASVSLPESAAAGLSIALALPTAFWGRNLDLRIRSGNEGIIAGAGSPGRGLLRSVSGAFMMCFASLLVIISLLCLFVSLTRHLMGDGLIEALSFLPAVCMVIGLASFMSKDKLTRGRLCTFCLGLLSMILVIWIL